MTSLFYYRIMKVNLFSKDPTVFSPVTLTLPAEKIEKGPGDARIQVFDRSDLPKAVPDRNGNFFYHPGDPQFDACQTYAVLKLGMGLYSHILQRDLPFAFRGKVTLYPHDGEGINAYYSREDHGVHFLEMTSPKFQHNLHTDTLLMAESLDVGAHEEAGHLLLDGMKPNFMNFELESQAFHEAFGDISAMILSLQFDQVLNMWLKETGGNLRKSNLVSKLGQEAGIAMQDLKRTPDPHHDFLRDAGACMQYNWKYQEPETLPEWAPKDEETLGAEPHNFSRFFSGLWYEVFVNLYEQELALQKTPLEAVKQARDIATDLILRSVADFSSDTTARYSDLARGMLEADRADFNGDHEKLLLQIFRNRGLFQDGQEQFRPLSLPPVKLQKPIASPGEAEKFLKSNRKLLGVEPNLRIKPAGDFPPGSPRYQYRNEKGDTFLIYHFQEEGSLVGSHYQEIQGAVYEVTGSLKLGFDRAGNLIHFSQDRINAGKHSRVQSNLLRFHKNGMIKVFQPGMALNGKESHFKEEEYRKVPYFAYASWNDGRLLLRRVPVFT